MPNTGLDVFDNTIQKTNELLIDIENELGWDNRRHQSYQALRVVLHALRDRLPIDDSVNFAAQLPLLVKGIYYDGWSSEAVPMRMDREEFVNRVRREFIFDVEDGVERVIRTVMEAIFRSINPNEAAKIKEMLPDDLANLL